MRRCLPHLKWIYLEVNFEELYAGCARVDDIDGFLSSHGFRRRVTAETGYGWGDALYCRRVEE